MRFKAECTVAIYIALTALMLVAYSCKKTGKLEPASLSYEITGIEPQFAGSGDTIVVYGTGFDPEPSRNQLTIHGVNASVINATKDRLTVITPACSKDGEVTVSTGGKRYLYSQRFTVATVVQGDQVTEQMWTRDRLYLLRKIARFKSGSALTIAAGTVILADAQTNAYLVIDENVPIKINGSPEQPVIFSSAQLAGQKYPGDWKGVRIDGRQETAGDRISYARIEFAGYHEPDSYGAALEIERPMAQTAVQYVQSSYSAGDGFRFSSVSDGMQYGLFLVALGCSGNDFSFTQNSKSSAQFLVGLKDPYYADQYSADGIFVGSASSVTLSNATLMGYNSLARRLVKTNIFPLLIGIIDPQKKVDDEAVNTNAGRGARVAGSLRLFNSVVAAPWLAGISIEGQAAWSNYEGGAGGSSFRHNVITYTTANALNSVRTLAGHPPYRGYSFAAENLNARKGFEDIASSSQLKLFDGFNDTLPLMLLPVPTTNPPLDDLGLQNLALYARITRPQFTLTSGSPLKFGADFSSTALGTSFFSVQTYRGAFGDVDWTRPWCNFSPQQSSYQ